MARLSDTDEGLIWLRNRLIEEFGARLGPSGAGAALPGRSDSWYRAKRLSGRQRAR